MQTYSVCSSALLVFPLFMGAHVSALSPTKTKQWAAGVVLKVSPLLKTAITSRLKKFTHTHTHTQFYLDYWGVMCLYRWTNLFNDAVGEGVGSHVKKQEVLLLCCQDTFLHQVLCQALPDVPKLVVQLQRIPGLSWVEKRIDSKQTLGMLSVFFLSTAAWSECERRGFGQNTVKCSTIRETSECMNQTSHPHYIIEMKVKVKPGHSG